MTLGPENVGAKNIIGIGFIMKTMFDHRKVAAIFCRANWIFWWGTQVNQQHMGKSFCPFVQEMILMSGVPHSELKGILPKFRLIINTFALIFEEESPFMSECIRGWYRQISEVPRNIKKLCLFSPAQLGWKIKTNCSIELTSFWWSVHMIPHHTWSCTKTG